MSHDVAGHACFAIELDRNRENAEDKRIPKEEERIKLADWSLAHDGYPREKEREDGERPHRFPNPALNKVFVAHHHMTNVDSLYRGIIAEFARLSWAIHSLPSTNFAGAKLVLRPLHARPVFG